MIIKDFLLPFMSLSPIVAAILVLIFNFLSLLIPTIRLNSMRNLFTNPAFIIGDFLAIPLAALLIVLFYKDFKSIPQDLTSVGFQITILIISFLLTLFSGIYFKLMKIYWVPHGIFHTLFGYLTLSFLLRAYGGVFYKHDSSFRTDRIAYNTWNYLP